MEVSLRLGKPVGTVFLAIINRTKGVSFSEWSHSRFNSLHKFSPLNLQEDSAHWHGLVNSTSSDIRSQSLNPMVLPYSIHSDPRLTRCPKLSPTSLPIVLAYSQAKGRSGPIEAIPVLNTSAERNDTPLGIETGKLAIRRNGTLKMTLFYCTGWNRSAKRTITQNGLVGLEPKRTHTRKKKRLLPLLFVELHWSKMPYTSFSRIKKGYKTTRALR